MAACYQKWGKKDESKNHWRPEHKQCRTSFTILCTSSKSQSHRNTSEAALSISNRESTANLQRVTLPSSERFPFTVCWRRASRRNVKLHRKRWKRWMESKAAGEWQVSGTHLWGALQVCKTAQQIHPDTDEGHQQRTHTTALLCFTRTSLLRLTLTNSRKSKKLKKIKIKTLMSERNKKLHFAYREN